MRGNYAKQSNTNDLFVHALGYHPAKDRTQLGHLEKVALIEWLGRNFPTFRRTLVNNSPMRTRTSDLRIRNPLLYPTEL